MGKESFYICSDIVNLKVVVLDDKLFSVKRVRKAYKNSKPLSPFAKNVKKQIENYLNGKNYHFSIPLADRGTEFQKSVWKTLYDIPYGKTQSYKDISLSIGSMSKARAVGQACGKNPFLLVVPCHRVVSKSSLGGFALGLKVKKSLLDLERSHIRV